MKSYQGKGVYGAIAIGKISLLNKPEAAVKRVRVDDTDGEKSRFEQAKASTLSQLQEIYDKALKEVGEANAAIFEIHQMMLDDEDYNESINNIIEKRQCRVCRCRDCGQFRRDVQFHERCLHESPCRRCSGHFKQNYKQPYGRNFKGKFLRRKGHNLCFRYGSQRDGLT